MKLALNLFLFLLIFEIGGRETFSLIDYKIKNICKKEKRKSICIKNLQEKRYKLQKGKLIEIPVLPYKSN